MTSTTALHAIGKPYKNTKPRKPWYHSRAHLEDAVLSPFTFNSEPKYQHYTLAVIIHSSTTLPELTEAFHNPSLLSSTGATLIHENLYFNLATGKSPSNSHYHVILIKTEASYWLIAAGIAGDIVVVAVIGFVVGHMVGNAQLGVQAGATAIAIFAFVQGRLSFLN